ncbi:MAG: hypothetical protein NTZ26_11115 [Candidatus Aminicenantes bacterium]|nr:hypothetical protein [Candidatus Aminicenantes bacterium]
MKKTIGFALILAALAAPAFPQLLSYKLTGNLAGISGGDYNDRILGENAYLRANSTSMMGAFEELRNGFGFQAEVILPLGRRFGVGVGGGYFRVRSEGSVSYKGISNGTAYDATSTLIPRLSIMPFFVNLHYQFELGSNLTLDAYAGPLFEIVQFNVENPTTMTILNTSQTVTFTASQTSLGAQGGLGLAYRVLKSVSIVADALYRTGKVSDLFGNWTMVGANDAGTIAGSSAEYYLWAFNSTTGGTFPRAGYFDKNGPTDADAAGAKKAEISLNGLSFQAGVRFSF